MFKFHVLKEMAMGHCVLWMQRCWLNNLVIYVKIKSLLIAIVRVMKETGKDLSSAYKETSLGGLAKEFGL